MGTLTYSHKKNLYDELLSNISDGTSAYYAFAANPISVSNTEILNSDDLSIYQEPNLRMIFGKRLSSSNFNPIIKKQIWTSGVIYTPYDNTKDLSNSLFYVISNPVISGGNYNIFKCIDNNNGSQSTIDPGTIPIQSSTIETSDGYKWRYITSITTELYDKFSSTLYSPVTTNSTIQSTAQSLSKIEKIVVSNGGSGYISYHSGKLGGYINSTAVYLASNASSNAGFYNNNSIYIYDSSNNYQLFAITNHYVSLDKRVAILSAEANISLISSDSTNYIISPIVSIESDSPLNNLPDAYSIVNTTSNSINSVVVLNSGSNISRANVSIISNYGSGANCYGIVPPPGGHGSNPAVELNMIGYAINFSFNGSENSTIPINVSYNKVGIIKNPYYINSNTYSKSSSQYIVNTFNQSVSGNVGATYTVGSAVFGANSKARAIVSAANSTYISLIGDYNFINGEMLTSSNGNPISTITIQDRPDIFSKDLFPIYINNINNTTRSNTQVETHKLVIKL